VFSSTLFQRGLRDLLVAGVGRQPDGHVLVDGVDGGAIRRHAGNGAANLLWRCRHDSGRKGGGGHYD